MKLITKREVALARVNAYRQGKIVVPGIDVRTYWQQLSDDEAVTVVWNEFNFACLNCSDYAAKETELVELVGGKFCRRCIEKALVLFDLAKERP